MARGLTSPQALPGTLKPHRQGWWESRKCWLLLSTTMKSLPGPKQGAEDWDAFMVSWSLLGSSRRRVGTASERHSGQHVVSSTKEVTETQGSTEARGGPNGFTASRQVLAPSQHRLGLPWTLLLLPIPTHPQYSQLLGPANLKALQDPELPGTTPRAPECKPLGCNPLFSPNTFGCHIPPSPSCTTVSRHPQTRPMPTEIYKGSSTPGTGTHQPSPC